MIRYLGLAPEQIRARYPEVVVQADARPGDVRVQAWVVGPGLGLDDAALALLTEVLATDVPVIVDADAITLVAARPGLIAGRHGADRADPARSRVHPARLRARRRPGRRRPARRGRARRDRAAQGQRHGRRRARRARPTSTAPARPGWPPPAAATCSAASSARCWPPGVEPTLAAAAAAHLHGVAGQLPRPTGRRRPPTSWPRCARRIAVDHAADRGRPGRLNGVPSTEAVDRSGRDPGQRRHAAGRDRAPR